MKKTSSTHLRWMVLMLAVFCWNMSSAQFCSLNCNDFLQVSLDVDCESEITYDVMLENPDDPNICLPNGNGAFMVQVMEPAPSGNTIPTSPVVTCDYIGQTLPVKVTHLATENECWGEIFIEDKIKPEIECTDANIWCNEPFDPDYIQLHYGVGYPDVSDNCDNYPFATNCDVIDLEFTDVWVDLDCTSNGISAQIIRTWTATDASLNSRSCTQTINLLRADLSHIDDLPDYDDIDLPAFDCASACAEALDSGEPAFDCTGYPNLHGLTIDETVWPQISGGSYNFSAAANGTSYCEINVTWEDTRIDICDGSFKILRDWRLVDWCTGEIHEYTQIIKVLDTQTAIICPAPMTVGTNLGPTTCGWIGQIPAATVVEDCSNFTVVTEVYEIIPQPPYGLGTTEVLQFVINGNGGAIPGGEYLAEGEHRIVYKVTDDCGNHAECETSITVEDDDAPTPVCIEQTQVTLDYFGNAIVYAEAFNSGSHDNCCEDDELTYEVSRNENFGYGPFVEFDCDDVGDEVMVFLRVTDCNGLTSEPCMVVVLVDDKTDPVITCENIEIACTEDYEDYLNETDLNVMASDACGVMVDIGNELVNLNACGVGTVRVRFTATDPSGNSTQTGFCQINIVDNTSYSISFPNDYDADVCSSPDDYDPSVTGNVNIIGDDCELIAINYFDEYLPVQDDACFKILRTWVVIDWCIYNPNDSSGEGRFEHIQVIKIFDNEAPMLDCPGPLTFEVDGDCVAQVVIPQPDVTDCSDDIDFDLEGDFTSFTTNNVELGDYTTTLIVSDNCGNSTECVIDISVIDAKDPTPYCVYGLVVELMPDGNGDGMVQLWASDFDAGSFDNCSDVTVSFSTNVNDTSIDFTCADAGNQTINLWVTDEAGNQDQCETFVIVESVPGVCTQSTGPLTIAGAAMTENNDGVEEVHVSLNTPVDFMSSMNTNDEGQYMFVDVPVEQDYTISPELDANPLNGVTTYDLVLMRQHILGTAPLASPYLVIAADVNNSGAVTTSDMVETRKLILGINTSFPNNTSWRFVDSAYDFPQANNPWAEVFPEVISYNNLTSNELNSNFVAIKVADLNFSAQPNFAADAEDRTVNTMVLNVADQAVKAGQNVTIDFSSADFDALGYQFTLNFDGLNFVEVAEGNAENFGFTNLDRGMITTSWNGVATDDALFSLTFTATQDAQLSDLLSISSAITKAEAYNREGETMDVAIQFGSGNAVAEGFALYQNTPNPFNGATVIGFNMAEAGAATLSIMDVSGKVVFTLNGDYARGYNQITVSSEQLPATGVLYYTLATANETATQRMVVTK